VLLKTLNEFFDRTGMPVLEDINFIELQFLLYGVALVAMMLLRPEGLFPNSRRKRELHTEMVEPGADELMGGDHELEQEDIR
jgi:hypothetical protein